MTHISLPESIEEIPEGCFSYSGLEEIVIPRKVKKIVGNGCCSGAFQCCGNLRSVVFEQGSELTEIGNWTFYKCRSLQNICLPDKLREIGWSAFSWTSLTEVQIPASVQTVGSSAFPEQAVILRPEDYQPEGVLTANMVREMLGK